MIPVQDIFSLDNVTFNITLRLTQVLFRQLSTSQVTFPNSRTSEHVDVNAGLATASVTISTEKFGSLSTPSLLGRWNEPHSDDYALKPSRQLKLRKSMISVAN